MGFPKNAKTSNVHSLLGYNKRKYKDVESRALLVYQGYIYQILTLVLRDFKRIRQSQSVKARQTRFKMAVTHIANAHHHTNKNTLECKTFIGKKQTADVVIWVRVASKYV